MNARAARRIAIVAAVLLDGCAHIARPPWVSTPAQPPPPPPYEIVQGRDAALVARLRAAPAPAEPEVSDGRTEQSDQSLLNIQGYVEIGIGHFHSRDQAVHQGRTVGADKVLIYAHASEEALTATYYVRLHLPFGANFRDLTADERQVLGTGGVQIGAVVGGTPAAKANLLEGDFVVKFNHAIVQDKASFQSLLQDHMGQRVTLTIHRDGRTIERIVRLGTLAR